MSSEVGSLRRSYVALTFAATISLVSLARNHDVPTWLVLLGGAVVVGSLWRNWAQPSVNGLLWNVAVTASPTIASMLGR